MPRICALCGQGQLPMFFDEVKVCVDCKIAAREMGLAVMHRLKQNPGLVVELRRIFGEWPLPNDKNQSEEA